MIDAISNLFTWRFGLGVIVGALGQRLAGWVWNAYQDRSHPLPHGKRRRLAGLSKTWVVGAAVVVVLAYQLYQAQRLASCQQEFATVLTARSQITSENDALSREQRELLAENQRAEAEWIGSLLHPEIVGRADIAALDPSDPNRQAWGMDVSTQYFAGADKVNERIADISRQQRANDEERARNPIPDPTCGRG